MTEEQAEEALRAVVSLARYGEVLSYDERSNAFSRDNPA